MVSAPVLPPAPSWHPLVALALSEDVGTGDITTRLSIPAEARGRARIEARQPMVVCGLAVGEEVFRRAGRDVAYRPRHRDGEVVEPGEVLVELEGALCEIMVAERTTLNFVSRLSGISTLTRRYVEAVSGTRARIVDTRKTLPGWRVLDKYAVAVGGGENHRVGLFDGILLKDNHVAAAGGIEPAVKAALSAAPANLRVQVEVQSAGEVAAAAEAGADFLLLDNQTPEEVAAIVAEWGDRLLLEASGGIHLDNVRAYAETGVHRISIGALTHSAPSCDVALELDGEPDQAPGEPEPGAVAR